MQNSQAVDPKTCESIMAIRTTILSKGCPLHIQLAGKPIRPISVFCRQPSIA